MTKSLKPSEKTSLIETKSQINIIKSWVEDAKDAVDTVLEEYGLKEEPVISENTHIKIENIFLRFTQVANQLVVRHDKRDSIKIKDEYDVQDLLHSLLRLYFDDVRAEEHMPSYAGVNPRLDILLKNEQIVIEVKKTRPSLSVDKLRTDLIVDKEQYRTHPDCKFLYCFVYDPERRVPNPVGFMRDLSGFGYGFVTKVMITY